MAMGHCNPSPPPKENIVPYRVKNGSQIKYEYIVSYLIKYEYIVSYLIKYKYIVSYLIKYSWPEGVKNWGRAPPYLIEHAL